MTEHSHVSDQLDAAFRDGVSAIQQATLRMIAEGEAKLEDREKVEALVEMIKAKFEAWLEDPEGGPCPHKPWYQPMVFWVAWSKTLMCPACAKIAFTGMSSEESRTCDICRVMDPPGNMHFSGQALFRGVPLDDGRAGAAVTIVFSACRGCYDLA